MDEIGFQQGHQTSEWVAFSKDTQPLAIKTSSSTWTSLIECGSAAGDALDPLVIFSGTEAREGYWPKKEDEIPNWDYVMSKKGWNNNEIAVNWLQNNFIRQTDPDHTKPYRILILDTHSSHITQEFQAEALSNNIRLIYIPPASSGLL